MTRILATLTTLSCIGGAFAQAPQNDVRIRVPEALQQTLSLNDSQIDRLRENDRAFRDEVRPLVRAYSDKARELRAETRADPPNESVIGTVTMELEDLGHQIEDLRATYQESGRALLSSQQLSILARIQDAAGLLDAVQEAISFNLVAAPERDDQDRRSSRRTDQRRGRR